MNISIALKDILRDTLLLNHYIGVGKRQILPKYFLGNKLGNAVEGVRYMLTFDMEARNATIVDC